MLSNSVEFLVDTHCHLNFDVFDKDRDNVIENARIKGVTRILIPGIDIETSNSALKFAEIYSEVYAAVGIHPNQGLTWNDEALSQLRELIACRKVVAIGEIGLDYYRDNTPKSIQLMIFKKQLTLASENGLPVIIHCRNASEDMINILRDWNQLNTQSSIKLANNPGVLHSFSGDKIFADYLFALNFKIGINGPVTFQNSKELQSLVTRTEIENILIETDAPFLSPHPFRGKRNEPANVRIIAGKLAELKGTSVNNIIKTTTAQADKLFGWRDIH